MSTLKNNTNQLRPSFSQSKAKAYGLLIALLIFIVAEFGVFLLDQNLRLRQAANQQTFATELRARAERHLNSVIYLTSGVVGYLSVNRQSIDPSELDQILSVVHADARHLRNFGIAEGFRLKYVFPRAGNEAAIGLDYRELPQQWPDVQKAISTHEGILSGPYSLKQGGAGIVFRRPIFIEGAYWGLLSTVIDLESFTHDVFSTVDTTDFRFAVQGSQGAQKLIWGAEEISGQKDVIGIEAAVPGGIWTYFVQPVQPYGFGVLWVLHALALLGSIVAGIEGYRAIKARLILAALAVTDALTGLSNRRLLLDRLGQVMARQSRHPGSRCVLLFIDLNDFKRVNDLYGHKAGDHLLTEVAQRMAEEVRTGDVLARLGGDEFAVLLEDTNANHTARIVTRLRQRIAAPMEYGGTTFAISAAIGMAKFPDDAIDANALLSAADERMYIDKQTGSSLSNLSLDF